MRIEQIKNIKQPISRLAGKFTSLDKREASLLFRRLGRDVLVGFLVTCFFFQPNLAIAGSVKSSLNAKSAASTENPKNDADTQKDSNGQTDAPLVKTGASSSKSANVFKAPNGLSKSDAAALQTRFENDLKSARQTEKSSDLTVNQNAANESKPEVKDAERAESGFSFGAIFSSFFGWFQSAPENTETSVNPALAPQLSAANIALVRHGFNVNSSRIEGSVQQLLGEATTINGQGVITQDLLVPGVPQLILNGNPSFAGVITGSGNATPTNYQITLNGGSQLRNLITRTNPVAMPPAPAPPASTGTQNVTINNSSQTPSNFSTIRDLTINGNAGTINVPPGTYRNFIVSGNSGIRLGTAGTTQPATYNLQSLTLNGNSRMLIAGPVNLNLASGLILNASVGISGNENWLKISVSTGGVTLNGTSTLYGGVIAPNGTVTINGNTKLIGNVACDRLIINGNGILRVLPLELVPSVDVSITSPANNSSTQSSAITVSGTASSAVGVANVYVNNQAATYNAANGTWTVSGVGLTVGSNTITARAVDTQGAEKTAQITVTRTSPPPDTTAPILSVTTPANNSTTQAEAITISGTVSDPGDNASGVASVTVNGVPATRDVLAGTWTLNNFSLNLGPNPISVRATDNANNVTTATLNVRREPTTPPDTIAPSISITSPENNSNVYTPEITVSGIAKDEGENATGVRQVRVNGHVAAYNPGNQTWTVGNILLAENENTVIAEVEDNATPTPNVKTAQIRVVRQNVLPPTVSITSPANGAVIASDVVTVAGNASSNAPNIPVTVKVNGLDASLAGSEFTRAINLSSGSNTITAVAVNSLNQTSETSVTIISDTQAPTVALQNVQPTVRPLLSYLIKAEANDNHALTSVEFTVNGERAALATAAPYEFTLQIPGDATPGNVYNISAIAKDLAGNIATDSVQTVIAGPSGVSGYVFDDKTGYSIEGATAALIDPPVSVTSDETGEYSLVSNSSFGVVRVSKNGHTPIERAFTTAAGTGLSLFDARLTGIDAQANQIENAGGTATGDGGRLQIAFPSGSFANQTDIRVSSVSQQGLINLLPFGWSPVPGAVVDVRAANSTAPVTQNLVVPAQLNISQTANLSSSILLTLVRYDESRHSWKVLQTGIAAGQNGALSANLPSLGQYAFLVADSGETTPPPPVVGSDLTSSVEVSPVALNNAQVTATANPKSAIVSPNAKSTISVLANSQTKLPSGVSIEASFNETYRLLNERNPIIVDRLAQDFVLYSYPSATAEQPRMLGASFTAKPTRADLTAAQLQFGNVHIGIHAGRTSVSGILIGSQGGEVSAQDGSTFRIEANSIAQNTSVFLEPVNTNVPGINLPEGFEIIGALDLSLSGATLTQTGKLSIPAVAGDTSRIVLAKVITAGSVRGLKAVARAVEENNRITSVTNGASVPSGVAFSGVKTGGRYVFVRVPMPFGYAGGTVKTVANAPAASARVTNDQMPFLDLTAADGKFLVLTKAESGQGGAANNLDAISLVNDATGNAQVLTGTQDAVSATDINLSSAPLGVTSINPADNAVNVLISSPVTVTFNKPVSPNSVTGSNFKVTTESGNPVVGTITLLSGNRAASFTPNSNLAFNTRYRVRLTTGVKDVYGVALASEFVSTFTTSPIISVDNRLKPEKIRIAYPNEQGYSTITIPAGSVPEGSNITVINNNSGATVSTVAGTQEIVLQILAQVGDEIILIIRQPDGTVYQVSQAAYRRADGFVTVGTNGGALTSDDGQVLLTIPRGAIEGQANIKMAPAAENEMTAPRTGDMSPTEMRFAAATKIEYSGTFTQNQELHLEMPAPPDVTEGQRVVFMQPTKISENGVEREVWQVVTSGTVVNGKLKTTSPPFMGVTLAGVLIGLTIALMFIACYIPPRAKAVVGKVTQARNNNVAVALPNATVQRADGESNIVVKTDARGQYALTYTNQTDIAKVKITHPDVPQPPLEVDTIPYQNTNGSWAAGLLNFETKYAAGEFPDPAGDPGNSPAIIQIEGRTQNLPDGEPDPLKLTGKVLTGTSVELTIKTTPSVEVITGTANINGANQQMLIERNANEPNTYKSIVSANTEGSYNITIETYTRRGVIISRARANFNFVALSNPNTCPSISGNPTILNGWTPRNEATNVDAGTRVHIGFSEPVKNLVAGQTVKLVEIGDDGAEKNVEGTVSSAGLPVGATTEVCSVDFQPSAGLKGGKLHKIKVTTGVRDKDDKPLQEEFTSTFTTFKSLILNEPNSLPTNAFKVAAAGDYMATIESGGSYPPTTRLKLYDISEPHNPAYLQEIFTPQYAISLDMIDYEDGQEITLVDSQGQETKYKTILAVTTVSIPLQDRPNNVWFYALGDDFGDSNIKLIGVVSLNYLNQSPDFPASVKILGKRAYVGSSTQGGFWVIDMEGAIFRLAEDSSVNPNAWFPATSPIGSIRGSGYATDRVRQKVPNIMRDVLWRTFGISAINQAVGNDTAPIVYPIPINAGQTTTKATAINVKGIQFDNRMAFFDANSNNIDDRVMSITDFNPEGYALDVKAASQVSLIGQTLDLAVYVTTNRFWVMDVTNPASPHQKTTVKFEDFGLPPTAQALQIEGRYVYVLFPDKVAVFDIGNLESPVLSSLITELGSGLMRFAVKDGFIYTVGATGLRVAIGRAFATVLVRGKPAGQEEEFCAAPVLLKKDTRKMAQKAEIVFQVFGHDVPQTASVKIRREKVVGGQRQTALLATIPARTTISGVQNVISGEAVWEYDEEIDLDASYTAEVVLDEGMGGELLSTPQAVPFSFLINKFPSTIGLTNDKSTDTSQNQPPDRVPGLGGFQFLLGAKATVTLTIGGKTIKPADKITGQLTGNDVFPFGLTNFYISKASFPNSEVLPDGQYQFELKAVYSDGPISETHTEHGFAIIGSIAPDVRHAGSNIVNGVELKSGNLALDYPEISIPNRGMPLELKRSYNSRTANVFSTFGYGWRHNYQILLSYDAQSKIYSMVDGEGSLKIFKEASINSENIMKAEAPGRGSLAKNADGSFDYITLTQTKYHFRTALLNSPNDAINVGYMGNLDYIEERNKNRITLKYDSSGRLEKVSATPERFLEFVYEQTNSATISGLNGEAGAVPCAKKNALKLLQKKFLQAYARKAWRIIEVKGPGGLKVQYNYDDETGNLIRAARVGLDDTISENILTAEWVYAYDETDGTNSTAVHLLETVQSPNHTETAPHITTYKYDFTKPEIPVKEIDFPEAIVNKFKYEKVSDLKKKTTVTDGRNLDTVYNFELRAVGDYRLAETVIDAPLSATSTITWREDGQKRKEVDAEGTTTDYFYDSNGNPTITQVSVTGEETFYLTTTSYDEKFNVPKQRTVRRKEGDTLVTNYTIDPNNGNVKQIDLPNGSKVTMKYKTNGDMYLSTDQFGNTTNITSFDDYGNPKTIEVRDAGGELIQTSEKRYDERSRLTQTYGNLEPTVTYGYNTLDHLVKQDVSDPAGYRDTLFFTATYKPEGQIATVERKGSLGLQYKATNTYDRANRLRNVSEIASGTLGFTQSYTYDKNSNVETATNRRGVTTKRVFNDLNFVTKESVVDSSTAEKTVMDVTEIDKVGSVKQFTDVYGKTIKQRYDGAHRLTQRIYSDCQEGNTTCTETFKYDGSNNLIYRTDKNGKGTTFEFDKLNRPAKTTNPLGYETVYTYTDAEHKTKIEDTTRGVSQTKIEDALNRPIKESLVFGGVSYTTDYVHEGLTTTITDPRSVVTEQKFSTFGDVGESKTKTGSGSFDQEYKTSMQYSAFGAMRLSTDAAARQTTYTVDGLNRITSAKYQKPAHISGDVTEKWEYDGEGLLTSYTDKRGIETTTTYDVLGREKLIKVDNTPVVNVLDITYNDSQATESRKDANNHTTTYVYDGLHRVKQLTDANSNVKSYTYDGENLRSETEFKAALKTKYEYDALNRLTRVTDRANRITRIDHTDGSEYVKTVTDRRSNKLIEKYDAIGRLIEVSRGGELLGRYEYDANNNRSASVDGEGNRSEFTYNNLNRLVVSRSGGTSGGSFTRTESYTHDAIGNLKVYSDGRGGSVSQDYDELNHLTEKRDGEQNKTTYKYDGEGFLSEMTEPCGNGGAGCGTGSYKTSYVYNAFGSLTNMTDADQKNWSYAYYPDGKLLKETTDPLTRKTGYEYDNLDRLRFIKQPLDATTEYRYDENGNVTTVIDPNGQTQSIVPDTLDRVDTHTYKDAAGAERLKYTYHYDAEDNVTQIDEALNIGTLQSFTQKRSFDARNRLETALDKFGHKVALTYDKADNIRSIKDFKSELSTTGTLTSYDYDRQNRLRTVTLPNQETVGYNWHADGLLEKVDYHATGMKREYSYDDADRMINIRNTVNASEIQEFSYGYDANSNRRSETKKLNGQISRTFGYKFDNLNRLTEAKETTPAPNTQPAPMETITVTESSSVKSFEYDAVGNREKEHAHNETVQISRYNNGSGNINETRGSPQLSAQQTASANFDQLNRLKKLTEANGNINDLDYDKNGNLLQTKLNGQTQQTFEYDPRDQLRRVAGPLNAEIAKYDYDPERRRIEKTVSGAQPERYVYAGDRIISEYRGSTGFEQDFAKYQSGAQETVRAEFYNGGEDSKYYFSDVLRSTTALAGKIAGTWTATNRYDYDSWGKVSNQVGGSANSIGYTGQRLDNETGLMALGNGERYYSPTLARFIQQDSFTGDVKNPVSLNRYSYVHNNPLTHRDPTGHYIESAWDAFSLGVGIYSFQANIRAGNYWSAALDAIGIIADAAALLLPIIPGGVGVAIRASRALAYTVKTVQTIDRAVNVYQAASASVDQFSKGNYGWGTLNAGFALLGAKGFSESAKGLSKLDDLNMGKGTPQYIKEGYDSLSKDWEKIKNFTSNAVDYTKAFVKGVSKPTSSLNMNMLGGQSIYQKLENGVNEVIKKSRKKAEKYEDFIARGTVTERAGTKWLQKTVDDWDDALMSGNKYQVHHLIAVSEAGKFGVMERAAELGYNVNRKNNLISLPTTIEEALRTKLPLHSGKHHNSYFGAVADQLQNLQKKYDAGKVSDSNLLNKIGEIENNIRERLLSGTLKLYED